MSRLLTLVGTGGVGKTRFAIRLAETVRKTFSDGEWFIDLARLSPGGSVAEEVSRVLRIPRVRQDSIDDLTRYFADKNGLLILDNCEHVDEDCAVVVESLLERCPQLSVLATSRSELRLLAERVFAVEPLTTVPFGPAGSSPAEMLFVERSSTTLPNPSAADREVISEICRRLDGLPLAIELAASRVSVLTPGEILKRLSQPFSLLTRSRRDAPDRQQTLRATIRWSYELCTPDERMLWRKMAVFLGGWNLQAAEWMCGDPPSGESVLDLVESLVEKSIVTRHREGDAVRFGMLETLRAFAIENSDPEELGDARSSQRDWCLDRLDALEADWYGPNQSSWLSFTRRELPNIRTALEFCLDSRDVQSASRLAMTASRLVWQANGRIREWIGWCRRIIDLGPHLSSEYCQVLGQCGAWSVALGDPEGELFLERAEAMAEELGDPVVRLQILDNRASSLTVSDPPKAARALSEALAGQGGHNLIQARSNLEERTSTAFDVAGQVDVAERMRASLIARSIAAGESYETSLLLLNAGVHAIRRGEVGRATEMLRQSLSLAQNLDAYAAVARVEEALAYAAAEGHEYERAATLLGMTFLEGDPMGNLWASIPTMGPIRVEVQEVVRQRLGERAYESAVARGRAMSVDDGVSYALGAQLPAQRRTRHDEGSMSALTARESQVAALVAQGLSDRQVSERLVISRRTAEGHVANALMKLGLTSRTQLAVWATAGPDSE